MLNPNDIIRISRDHIAAVKEVIQSYMEVDTCEVRAARYSSATARDRFVFSTFNVAQFAEDEPKYLEDTTAFSPENLSGKQIMLEHYRIVWVLYLYSVEPRTLPRIITVTQQFDDQGNCASVIV